MDEIIKLVALHFGYKNVEIEVIQKKLSYLIKTKDENLLIKRSFKEDSDVLRQEQMQNAIAKNEFTNLSFFVLDENNLPYCNIEEESYTLLRNISTTQVSFINKEEALLSIKALANFHKHTKNSEISDEFKLITTFNDDDISNEITEMDKLKKQISKAKKKTEFDIYFIKNYDKYVKRAIRAKEILSESNYKDIENTYIKNNSICLNLIKEEQFTLQDGEILLSSLTESSIGYQLNDLVKFIHRYLQKNITNDNDDLLSFDEIIEAYSSVNTIEPMDLKIIKAKLMFPREFFKVVKTHYKKHRGWTLGLVTSKTKELEHIDNIYLSYCDTTNI